jgi:two-component system sensor histidine kinase/response regulator
MTNDPAADTAAASADAPVCVLVVDDIEQNRVAMQALLARPGVAVLSAASGAQALELLLVHDVALALLDVQMPEMDGFALAELMRGTERTRGVPIIFLTAAPQDGQRSFRGYEAGAVDFLWKPVEPHAIRSKVAVFVELHRQRRQLRDGLAQLQRALVLNDTMAAVLSHDLRTPLSAIAMSAELILRTTGEDATLRAATRIKSSSARMAAMITQLLDFSRIRAGSVRLEPKPAQLGEICRAALAELRQARPDARIELHCEGDLAATLDADRVMQVVSNLASNALQHGTPGSPVQVFADGRDAATLRLRVVNDGTLADEVRQRLFEPFQSSRSSSGGLGLGLHIVDHFVRAHGGTVDARATADGHVVFEVTLPRRPEGAAAC